LRHLPMIACDVWRAPLGSPDGPTAWPDAGTGQAYGHVVRWL